MALFQCCQTRQLQATTGFFVRARPSVESCATFSARLQGTCLDKIQIKPGAARGLFYIQPPGQLLGNYGCIAAQTNESIRNFGLKAR